MRVQKDKAKKEPRTQTRARATSASPSQDAPVDDTESSKAKAAPTSSPAKNLTLDEGKARAQVVKAAPQKRADDGAAAAKKRAASDSPTSELSTVKGFRSLFDASDKVEEEGAVTDPQEIYNDLDEEQERYQAAQLQGASEVASSASPTPVYPHGYYPPDAGSWSPMFPEHLKAPRGLNHGRTSRGACERASVQDEPLFATTSRPLGIHESPEETRRPWWALPRVGYPLGTARELHNPIPGRGPVLEELKELREDRLLSYVLDQRDLRIAFAHLITKRQLHSVMEGLRQQSKSSAQDERGYGSRRKAVKKPRTTYAPVDPRSQQTSGSQPGAGLPAPTSSVTRGIPATSQAAGASQNATALGRPAPHGCGARRSDHPEKELDPWWIHESPSDSDPGTLPQDCVPDR
ncbi:ATP-binding cassette (ABC) Superfamily [Phytophthora palmivora]|uniref:ATP-binding cassette (ABC) Superfamily n=1 Tax=Phytophthora palmivora TaxID=4796 RepID=A0A2P4XNA3_9STRA|nr:ATP-binding cassette (ABC) Superfamily [Phytophthora palmivora]